MKALLVRLFLLCVILILGLFICSVLLAQEVAIYKDKSDAWIDSGQMAPAAQKALDAKGIKNNLVNAADLVTYMNANKTGIVIIATGLAPSEIFTNQAGKDPVRQWLIDGGVLIWTGDWPFYYWDVTANLSGAAGEIAVFGVTITSGTVSTMEPTVLGKKLIPSIKEHTANRPIILATLKNNKFNYESYADNGALADPIALQTSQMKGWFVNMHTWPVIAEETYDQLGKQMAEIIKNRFLVAPKTVEKAGKLTTSWGDLKTH